MFDETCWWKCFKILMQETSPANYVLFGFVSLTSSTECPILLI